MSEMNVRQAAVVISAFMDLQSNRYDERRDTPYWAPIMKLWNEAYERDKRSGRYSFSECARNANIEAISAILSDEVGG